MRIFVRLSITAAFVLASSTCRPFPRPTATPTTVPTETAIPLETLLLRYNAQPGDEFRTRMAMEGKMAIEVFQIERVEETEHRVTYELVWMQTVESVAEDGTFVAKIEPIPETVTMSIDGKSQEVELELLPEVLIRMTRLGEIVELKYVTPSTQIALGREDFNFISNISAFPRFPEEELEIGDSWELLSTSPHTGFEGVAKLLGLEQVNGYPSAKILVRSSMPVAIPEKLERDFASQRLSVQGKVETEMTQFFELERGWPLSGNGGFIYDVTLYRNGEKVSHTTYNFDVSFITTFEEVN